MFGLSDSDQAVEIVNNRLKLNVSNVRNGAMILQFQLAGASRNRLTNEPRAFHLQK